MEFGGGGGEKKKKKGPGKRLMVTLYYIGHSFYTGIDNFLIRT